MAAITLRGVGKSFGKAGVIEGVDLEIGDKEFIVFVGPSGCGKSTLLRLVAGLEDLSAGEILFDGQAVHELPPAERGVAMVFQSYALYPHMTVFDNMAFGLGLGPRRFAPPPAGGGAGNSQSTASRPRNGPAAQSRPSWPGLGAARRLGLWLAGGGKAAIAERVREAARILQLTELLDRKPRELSGGQRQRVAIGRAIVRNPRVFLFDEPLSNLDAALRVQMRIEIARLHRSLDATMIYVTHDQVEAMTLADRIVVLNAGRVEQVGSPLELYHHPRNLFVAGFIGSPRMNFVEGVVAGVGDGVLAVDLGEGVRAEVPAQAGAVTAGQRVTLGIRPEHLAQGEGGELRFAGEVIAVERLGSETYIHLARATGAPLLVKAEGGAEARVGERLAVDAPAAACYLFGESGQAFPRPGGAPEPIRESG